MSSTFGQASVTFWRAASMLLGWKPEEFWKATPAELLVAFGEGGAEAPLDRATVARLQRLFPDDQG